MAVTGAKRKQTHISPAKASKKAKVVPRIEKQTLIFLKNLHKNNNKEWMQAHKDYYQAAKDNFEAFTAAVLARMQGVDAFVHEVSAGKLLVGEEDGAAASSGMHEFVERINYKFPGAEDGPYNRYLGFHLLPKSLRSKRATYALRVQPFGHTTLLAGLEKGDGATLTALRTGLSEDAEQLEEALETEEVKEEFGGDGLSLLDEHGEPITKAPKGFRKDHEHIELLKNRRFIVVKTFKDDEVLDESFIDEVVSAFTAAEPFVSELNRTIAENEPEEDEEEEHEEEEEEADDEEEDSEEEED